MAPARAQGSAFVPVPAAGAVRTAAARRRRRRRKGPRPRLQASISSLASPSSASRPVYQKEIAFTVPTSLLFKRGRVGSRRERGPDGGKRASAAGGAAAGSMAAILRRGPTENLGREGGVFSSAVYSKPAKIASGILGAPSDGREGPAARFFDAP